MTDVHANNMCKVNHLHNLGYATIYGVKILTFSDSKTSYALQAQMCTKKERLSWPRIIQVVCVVRDFSYEYLGRNVTCNNFFASYNL